MEVAQLAAVPILLAFFIPRHDLSWHAGDHGGAAPKFKAAERNDSAANDRAIGYPIGKRVIPDTAFTEGIAMNPTAEREQRIKETLRAYQDEEISLGRVAEILNLHSTDVQQLLVTHTIHLTLTVED